ncbi:protein of unknown function [Filimonas lacunae]|uniref:DUF4261 domain-containing protein n=1 Tax=Filimonas lacunae TaxID=477680 RepID=A0A173MA02_9BACT|nr:DUF4261 domain-containing protein [Filimonas lacunae]BAV04365.1 hypothetical protein FLA_0353 [Filimonas lacunae]SIT31156.1 protein of unknown function [Filimonas lacunae]
MFTGIVLVKGAAALNADGFVKDFTEWSAAAMKELVRDTNTLLLNIEGATVAISAVNTPVDAKEINAAGRNAYQWPNVVQQAQKHQSQLVIAISEEEADALKHYMILTEVAASLLRTSEGTVVYMPGQSLLIPKAYYLEEAESMDEYYYPLHLWLTFGRQQDEKGNSGYTSGLKEFGKMELEINDATASPEAITSVLFNIAHYILENDVMFASGDTCSLSETEEVAIQCSPGKLVKGITCKLLL